MNKICTKCKEERPIEEFHRCKQSPGGRRAECKHCRKEYARKYLQSKKDPYYSVYYLPEEHYCGYTSYLEDRMRVHENAGRNIEGWRVLYATESKEDARHHENFFHSWMGMEGIKLD